MNGNNGDWGVMSGPWTPGPGLMTRHSGGAVPWPGRGLVWRLLGRKLARETEAWLAGMG